MHARLVQCYMCLLFSFVSQSYETGALLLADEAGVIAGLLVGLNVIDCNVAIKDDDLDQPVGGSTALVTHDP